MTDKAKVLVLGGTAEARNLAELIEKKFQGKITLINSLAGRTQNPVAIPGLSRVGGFGGALGLENFLKTEKISAVIDATHPFAETISEHAYDACYRAEIARITLARPEWKLPPSASWIEANDVKDATQMLPKISTRVFLTTGTYQLARFATLKKLFFLIRLIERPDQFPDFENHHLITARPPYDLESDEALFNDFKIDALVCKNSGGAIPAKIDIALKNRIPIVLIKRPAPVPGPMTTDANECIRCLEKLI